MAPLQREGAQKTKQRTHPATKKDAGKLQDRPEGLNSILSEPIVVRTIDFKLLVLRNT